MSRNDVAIKAASNNIQQLPQEVLVKYGWIVLATPVLMHLINKAYDFALAKEVMANNYELSVNPKTSDVCLTKQLALTS